MSAVVYLDEDISPIIPKLTVSRYEFAKYIISLCILPEAEVNYLNLLKDVNKVIHKRNYRGHYFFGMIYVKSLSFTVILHELFHHIFFKLRNKTRCGGWIWMDDKMDELQLGILRTKVRLECKILNSIHYRDNYHYVME